MSSNIVSKEARTAAEDNYGPPASAHGVITLERHEQRIQRAIDEATQSLQSECDKLHQAFMLLQQNEGRLVEIKHNLERERDKLLTTIELLERGKYGRTDMAMQILSLEEERDKLRKALEKLGQEFMHISHATYQGGDFEFLFRELFYRVERLRPIADDALNHSKSTTQ